MFLGEKKTYNSCFVLHHFLEEIKILNWQIPNASNCCSNSGNIKHFITWFRHIILLKIMK